MTKPSAAQTEAIRYFNGMGTTSQRVTEATYAACVRNGWIEKIEEHPYHRTLQAGAAAIGVPLQTPAPAVPEFGLHSGCRVVGCDHGIPTPAVEQQHAAQDEPETDDGPKCLVCGKGDHDHLYARQPMGTEHLPKWGQPTPERREAVDGRHLELFNDGMGFLPREHAITDSPKVAELHRAIGTLRSQPETPHQGRDTDDDQDGHDTYTPGDFGREIVDRHAPAPRHGRLTLGAALDQPIPVPTTSDGSPLAALRDATGPLDDTTALRVLDGIATGLEGLAAIRQAAQQYGGDLADGTDPKATREAAAVVRAVRDAAALPAGALPLTDDPAPGSWYGWRDGHRVCVFPSRGAGDAAIRARAVDCTSPAEHYKPRSQAQPAEVTVRLSADASDFQHGLFEAAIANTRAALVTLMAVDGFISSPLGPLDDARGIVEHPAGVRVFMDEDGTVISYPDDNVADGDDGEVRGSVRIAFGATYAALRDVAVGLVAVVGGKAGAVTGDHVEEVGLAGLDQRAGTVRDILDLVEEYGGACSSAQYEDGVGATSNARAVSAQAITLLAQIRVKLTDLLDDETGG